MAKCPCRECKNYGGSDQLTHILATLALMIVHSIYIG